MRLVCFLCFVSYFLPLPVFAESTFDRDFAAVSRRCGVPALLLKAIARQESDFDPLVINIAGRDYRAHDREHALALIRRAEALGVQYDVGLMQINRYWIHKWSLSPGQLLDPFENIAVGGRILSEEIGRSGLTWEAIGHYHSRTPWRARDYAKKIRRHLEWLLDMG